MRSMDVSRADHTDLTGSLLVAVPSLLDPNFRRTIIFLTRHEAADGAFGVILNRPCGITLGELTESLGDNQDLYQIPVFEGGPVEQHHLILAHIELLESGARFEAFGEDEIVGYNEIQENTLHDNCEYRAFTGYAGWTAGQLESEIKEKSWMILPPTASLLKTVLTPEEGIAHWRGIMKELGPWYRLLAQAPDDLSLN